MEENIFEIPKKNVKKEIISWIRTLAIAGIASALVLIFVAQFVNISGRSMEPTYHNGDRVLIYKLNKNYEFGDIIVADKILDEPIIKRVIATEGQTVDFDSETKEVVVDGKTIPGETFGIENHQTITEDLTGTMLTFPQTVPKDCVFVLGDNRMHSSDSRFTKIGMIPKDKILGKVILNIFPFEKFGPVK